MILFKCTECGGALKTSNPNLVGKKIKCPKCGAAVPVPAESGGGKPVPAVAPGPRSPTKAPPKPSPPDDWEDDEAPPLPKAKGKKPVPKDDWDEEEAPPSKPAAKPRKKGGIDAVAILVVLLLAGYIAAVVLFMLDIVQI